MSWLALMVFLAQCSFLCSELNFNNSNCMRMHDVNLYQFCSVYIYTGWFKKGIKLSREPCSITNLP